MSMLQKSEQRAERARTAKEAAEAHQKNVARFVRRVAAEMSSEIMSDVSVMGSVM